MMRRDYEAEVCAAAHEVDDALGKLVAAPHDLEECHKHLASAIWHLSEAVKAPRATGDEAAQAKVVDELQKKILHLNRLFRNAQSFYRGWASLAGVNEVDGRRGNLSMQG